MDEEIVNIDQNIIETNDEPIQFEEEEEFIHHEINLNDQTNQNPIEEIDHKMPFFPMVTGSIVVSGEPVDIKIEPPPIKPNKKEKKKEGYSECCLLL